MNYSLILKTFFRESLEWYNSPRRNGGAMHRALSLVSLVALVLVSFVFLSELNAGGHSSVVRGWLSDEGCASGRASSGTYTGTNPDCAKKCVRDGKRIVLVDPDHKRLLTIVNQDAAIERVGDYVEISGDLDEHARTLHIESLKLIEKGRAMCDVPPKHKT